MAAGKRKKHAGKSISEENLESGIQLIKRHPLFSLLGGYLCIFDKNRMGSRTAAARVDRGGTIYLNKDVMLMPVQWAYAIAHCQLHLAFGHFDAEKVPGYEITDEDGRTVWKPHFQIALWNHACDLYIAKFLQDIKFAYPMQAGDLAAFSGSFSSERAIYERLAEMSHGHLEFAFGTASLQEPDMLGLESPNVYQGQMYNRYAAQFAHALAASVSRAVSGAAYHTAKQKPETMISKAAVWFQNHYPLLGALAASFRIVEDFEVCRRHEIQVAAVDAAAGEIYVNPAASNDPEEWKFILAHEYLHAGLEHHCRCQGRDPYLWNIACDFVINDWLKEMQVGAVPEVGLLYDETLHGLSAESIYDRIVGDFRKFSKMNTLRGYGLGDVIRDSDPAFSDRHRHTTLDDFYRNALQQGLEYQLEKGRGLIPEGLVEEIRALAMPPIPWDVKLARWFDCHFAPLEQRRTYARPSRRQGATPDIPRPRYVPDEAAREGRTFGVVVDTSGSMSSRELGMALGSIASYAAAHEVALVRVVFCDAAAYDMGYLAPEELAGRVQVRGRGGTVLQPGVDLLEQAKDFPKEGPVLIITDGWIEEHLKVKFEHAFLLPEGGRLPFRAKGEVFYFGRVGK